MGNSLRELLMNAKIRSNSKSLFQDNPNDLGEDGVDHINISNQAKTELGQSLAQDVFIPFVHPVYGKFNTVTGFWYYISSSTRDEYCRTMSSGKLRAIFKGRKLPPVKNFKAIILEAYWLKITQHEAIKKELMESTLPIDCYFFKEGENNRTRPRNHRWLLQGLNEIRNALKKNTDFNYTRFLDIPGSDIYEFADDHVEKTKVPETEDTVVTPPAEADGVDEETEVTTQQVSDNAPIGYEEAPEAA